MCEASFLSTGQYSSPKAQFLRNAISNPFMYLPRYNLVETTCGTFASSLARFATLRRCLLAGT